jgi:NAD(P)-dependent dehydrogenase (short-subunit alcohol dehydrogenase family)
MAPVAGIVNLTKQLALELAPDVRVNTTAPGCTAPGCIATDHVLERVDADAVINSLIEATPAAASWNPSRGCPCRCLRRRNRIHDGSNHHPRPGNHKRLLTTPA